MPIFFLFLGASTFDSIKVECQLQLVYEDLAFVMLFTTMSIFKESDWLDININFLLDNTYYLISPSRN